MQEFSWQARTRSGKLLSGKLRAKSEAEACSLVRNNYGFVVRLQVKESTWSSLQEKLLGSPSTLTDKQRIVFFKQLATILNSGVPLLDGMELLRQRTDIAIGKVAVKLVTHLQEGSSLASAMQKCGKTFSNLAVTLVAAGERSGELNNVFLEIADFYKKQQELKQFLYKATLYPLFLLFASVGVLIFFLLYVLPMLASVYSSLGAPPNEILQFAVQISNFLIGNGVAVCLSLVAMFFYIYYRRQIIVEFCLRLPIVRNLYAMALEIRFCKILSMLLDKGINITEAVELAAATIRQKERVRQLKIFNAALRRGEAISTALGTATEMFSPLTAELIVIGAETGYLPKLLNEAANILEQDLRDRLEKLREILAPILLLMAALVTATVVCSVVGPLFELFSALPEYK